MLLSQQSSAVWIEPLITESIDLLTIVLVGILLRLRNFHQNVSNTQQQEENSQPENVVYTFVIKY